MEELMDPLLGGEGNQEQVKTRYSRFLEFKTRNPDKWLDINRQAALRYYYKNKETISQKRREKRLALKNG